MTETLWQAVVLLCLVVVTAGIASFWTWWLTRDRHRPLRDAAATSQDVAVAATTLVRKLGDELAHTHAANAEILGALLVSNRGGVGAVGSANGRGDHLSHLEDEESIGAYAEAQESVRAYRNQRVARASAVRNGVPVDPDENLDDADE